MGQRGVNHQSGKAAIPVGERMGHYRLSEAIGRKGACQFGCPSSARNLLEPFSALLQGWEANVALARSADRRASSIGEGLTRHSRCGLQGVGLVEVECAEPAPVGVSDRFHRWPQE